MLFSEPKIPQFCSSRRVHQARGGFSALQRAENSSINPPLIHSRRSVEFQCSSASRKFLNSSAVKITSLPSTVSVLFSEPKIPQPQTAMRSRGLSPCFSALQRAENSSITRFGVRSGLRANGFSALQRAENSSIGSKSAFALNPMPFQCSSASRKFLNRKTSSPPTKPPCCFSALQRAENSSTARV